MRNNLALICIIILSLFIVISCEEDEKAGKNIISDIYNFPNPFSPSGDDENKKNTTILIKYNNNDKTSKVLIEVDIKSMDAFPIWSFSREYQIQDPTQTLTEFKITWSGENDNGDTVYPGIYIADVLIKALEQSATGDINNITSVGGSVNEDRIKMVVE